MAKILLTEEFQKEIGPSMAMDCHWIDVKLKSGKVYRKLVVRGGAYITGITGSKNGISDLDFTESDILKVRRQSIFPWFF